MSKKMWGLVCDNCLVFCPYTSDEIKRWILTNSSSCEYQYCSKKCQEEHKRE